MQILGDQGMKIRPTVHAVIACLFLLVSCANPSQTTKNTPSASDIPASSTIEPALTITHSSSTSPAPTAYQTTLTAVPQVTPVESTAFPTLPAPIPAQYDLVASFDYFAHSLSVAESIRYTNQISESIPDLTLVVEPNRWQGGFELVSITWEDGVSITGYELKDAQLHIPLAQPLQPGERLGLKISYLLTLPVIPEPSEFNRPVPYGYTERQTNIVDWYPYIPPYIEGSGWLVHKKWWFGEHQVFTMADFQVKLTLVEPVRI